MHIHIITQLHIYITLKKKKKIHKIFVTKMCDDNVVSLIVTHIKHIQCDTFPFLVIVVMASNQQSAFYHSKTGSKTCAPRAWRSMPSKSGNRKQGQTVEARSGHKVVLNSLCE